jgi:hypothetical protein
MTPTPTNEAVRRETSRKPLMRENPAEFLGTGYQCQYGLIPLSIIFESVETFTRIVGLYLGVLPPTCILVLSIPWLFFRIICKIHRLMCVDTYSQN